jgi:hypothetical protein
MKKIFHLFVMAVLAAASLHAQPVTPVKLTPHATGFINPVGIDHHEPTNKIVMSVNYPSGQPHNFELVDIVTGVRQQFSNIRGLTEEVKIATARDDGGGMSLGGFTPGELFTGTGVPGNIARISPDGSTIQNPWVALPGETGLLRGSLHIDRTGVFGGDLIVVTTEPAGSVWRVTSAGVPTKLAAIGTHLEGVTTVPDNPVKYGPWAGKILAGAEQQGRVYSIDRQGNTAFFTLGINPEDIDIIPANENFFGIDFSGQTLWTAPPAEFADKIGDVLIAQEDGGLLFHVRWTGAQFQVTRVAQVSQWEHMTFSTSPVDTISCEVKIISPKNGALICGGNVEVTAARSIQGGKPPFTTQCDINGIAATVVDSTFSATVPCSPGDNLIVATCRVTDSEQQTVICRDSIRVICAAPPTCKVEITAPADSAFLCVDSVKVIATTTISGGVPPFTIVCDINGRPVVVSGNAFMATVPLTPGWNDLIVTCTVTDSCGKKTVCREVRRVLSIIDKTPPSCVFTHGYKSVTGTFIDNESGIAKIEPLFLFNAKLTVDPFTPGDKQVNFRLDELGLESYLGFDIKITDVCGNEHICDPVLLQLEAARKNQAVSVTFRRIDHYLILTNYGLTKIRIDLNGQPFNLLSQPASAAHDLNSYHLPADGEVTIDLQKYLRDGDNNIRFEFDGPAGTGANVMLIDEAHQIDHALELLPLPAEYQLSQNYPNPFNPTTTIRFSVPARVAEGAAVQLRIYNMLGELMRVLIDEKMFPGNYAVMWDGRNSRGEITASGIYIYQLIAGEFRQTKRMIFLK